MTAPDGAAGGGSWPSTPLQEARRVRSREPREPRGDPERPGMNAADHLTMVGLRPNGLAAAIRCAQQELGVCLIERSETPGGMSVQRRAPEGAREPVLSDAPVSRYRLSWVRPPVLLAHPLDGEDTVCLHRDLGQTAVTLGRTARWTETSWRPSWSTTGRCTPRSWPR